MTQQERNELATRLGITREKYPQLWACDCETCGLSSDCCYCGLPDYSPTYYTILPDPDSDDPLVCLWEPFLMRALESCCGLPCINKSSHPPTRYTVYSPEPTHGATPTAALYAAWLAKEKP